MLIIPINATCINYALGAESQRHTVVAVVCVHVSVCVCVCNSVSLISWQKNKRWKIAKLPTADYFATWQFDLYNKSGGSPENITVKAKKP